MERYFTNVAIIGAGLAGCALALALSQQGIPVTVYESRPKVSFVVPSGVILTPNGLHVLDRLGVFERIAHQCYKTRYRILKDANDRTTEKTLTADESRFHYCNHRIWRGILLDEMRAMLAERNVPIFYSSKFNGITSDTNDPHGLTFLINDEPKQASWLLGADGLHSSVRQHLAPGTQPEYTGNLYLISHIKRSSVEWPYHDYECNATIQDIPGSLFFTAEDPQGKELMIGRQFAHDLLSREEQVAMQADTARMVALFRGEYENWGCTGKKIIDAATIDNDTLYVWPAWKMPRLKRWFSESGNVVLLGDGAHAMPASTGQGVNQALEDVYALSLLLTRSGERRPEYSLVRALTFWQEYRQSRIDEILEFTENYTDVERMSVEERNKIRADTPVRVDRSDMAWLYSPEIERHVDEWKASQRIGGQVK